MKELALMSTATFASTPESKAIVMHLGDISTSTTLTTSMLHHVSIELGKGLQSSIWNFDDIAPSAISMQIKKLCAAFPKALVQTLPPRADLAILYGLNVLEGVAAKIPAGFAAAFVVIVENAEDIEPTKRKLAGLGWQGTVRLLAKVLFGVSEQAASRLWALTLDTQTGPVRCPETLELGMSFVGHMPSDADLAFLSALQRESGHPVVVMTDEAALSKLHGCGAEVLVARKNAKPWGKFFDRISILVEIGDNLKKARLRGAIAKAFQCNRGVIALNSAGLVAPGVKSFRTQASLLAFLRNFTLADLDPLLTHSRAEASTHLGTEFHHRRLQAMLQTSVSAPEATTTAINVVPDQNTALDDVVRLLIDAPLALGLEWLRHGRKPQFLLKVLQRLGAMQELSKITDLYEAVATLASDPDEVEAFPESTQFLLGAHAASAYASHYVRNRALDIIMQLEATAYRKRLNTEDSIRFQQRKANILAKAGQRDAALAILTELVERHPHDVSSLVELGLAIVATEPQRACDLLQKALGSSKKPAALRVSTGLAHALCRLGRHEEALGVLHNAVARHGDEPSLRIAIANAHLGLGYRKDWADVLLPLFPTQYEKPALAIDSQDGVPVLDVFSPAKGLRPEPVAAESPLVAVVMTAYNAADTITQAMRSVLTQTYPNLRLVVVDDVSTDATLAVMHQIAQQDPRVIILQQRENAGTYVAKNQALALVHADYYTFLDSDDVMHPCRIAAHLDFMAHNPAVVCSYSKWLRVAPDGAVVTGPLENPASCFLPRATLEDFGYFDMVRAGADGEFRWRLRRRYGRAAVPVMPEILTIGTQRAGSLTTGGATAFDDFGYSAARVAYAEAWADWHRNTAPADLYLPFPQQQRKFAAPPELAVPVAPFPHPFALRRAGEMPPEDAIIVEWPAKEDIVRNWGDKLNAFLVHRLAGKAVLNHLDPKRDKKAPIHLVIGSGLANTSDRKLVWGTGFIDSQMRLKASARQICAVRGPLSRAHVIETEGNCTDVLGDAALLCPLIYLPKIEAQFDVGVILHFREAGFAALPLLPKGKSMRLIDINGGIEEVIDSILSCRHIVSSSLHGIIAAHAYGVPATWLRFTERPKGDGFKFRDYWASMGRDDMQPTQVQAGQTLDYQATIATPGKNVLVDLYRLLRACPFLTPAQAEDLVQRAKDVRPKALPASILNCHAGVLREG